MMTTANCKTSLRPMSDGMPGPTNLTVEAQELLSTIDGLRSLADEIEANLVGPSPAMKGESLDKPAGILNTVSVALSDARQLHEQLKGILARLTN